MKKQLFGRAATLLTAITLLFSLIIVPAGAAAGTDAGGRAAVRDINVSSRIYELLFGTEEELRLCPGGSVFGVRIHGVGVYVEDVSSGIHTIKRGDRITGIAGQTVKSGEEIKRLISKSRGGSVRVTYLRGGCEHETELLPTKVGDSYQLGLLLSDGAAGIGTVTFLDPETGLFGGLGHGICDGDGNVISMESGDVTGVILGGVERGAAGDPGELRGVLTGKKTGYLTKNCECGVFGKLEILPEKPYTPLPVGKSGDVHTGAAEILCTVRSGNVEKYGISITGLEESTDGTRSFRIAVTDPDLIAITGGIVRGMSGSPIIQDGKLIGAVTHVMIGDPTVGYGIFIENMLNAAKGAEPEAA